MNEQYYKWNNDAVDADVWMYAKVVDDKAYILLRNTNKWEQAQELCIPRRVKDSNNYITHNCKPISKAEAFAAIL